MKKPTISDVAALAGVAKSTVSAVINDKDVVAAETRRKVLKAIKELNYRPRASARQRLQSNTRRNIGFVVKESNNPYYTDVLSGIEAVARKKGYQTYLSSSAGQFEAEARIIEALFDMGISGLIITPILNEDVDLSYLFELKRNNVPFVLLEKVRGFQTNLIDIDNELASSEAVQHLLGLGHSEIVHFSGPPYSEHSEERVQGVRRAFSESLLRFDASYVVPAGDSLNEGYRAAFDYFSTRDRHPTAVTCYNDLVALGVLKALRELDIRVPEEVSLVGFDNLNILEYLSIPLTTVHVPRYEMGAKAAEILIQNIESPNGQPFEKVTLEASMVVRGTTAAPRS